MRATLGPTLLDIKAELAGSKFFSGIDLRQGFFQVPITEESKKFTAFASTGTDLYEYNCIPMGCSVSAAILQSALLEVFGSLYFQGVIVYVDDILVYSKGSLADHYDLLNRVLTKLEGADARVKAAKVHLAVTSLNFLGMKVSASGWELSSKFLASVKQAERPTCLKSLRSFLGLCN